MIACFGDAPRSHVRVSTDTAGTIAIVVLPSTVAPSVATCVRVALMGLRVDGLAGAVIRLSPHEHGAGVDCAVVGLWAIDTDGTRAIRAIDVVEKKRDSR